MRRAFTDARDTATGVSGTVRIGTHSPVNLGERFLDIIREFESRFPRASVVLTDTGLARDPCDWLRAGEVHMLALRLPLPEPDIALGPVLSSERRVLLVARDDPLAGLERVAVEDFADRAIADAPALRRELADVRVPCGRAGRRVEVRSVGEVVLRIAGGEIVHPDVGSFIRHYNHPGIVAIPLTRLPPSETALVWLAAHRPPKIDGFAETAREVLRGRTGDGPKRSSRDAARSR
jgi:hypothetical protein